MNGLNLNLIVASIVLLIIASVAAILVLDLTDPHAQTSDTVGHIVTVVVPTVSSLFALIAVWQTRARVTTMSAKVDRVHHAVNGQRTSMIALIARLRKRISQDNPEDKELLAAAEEALAASDDEWSE